MSLYKSQQQKEFFRSSTYTGLIVSQFSFQNDFLDAFPTNGSAVGNSTDIQDGRCSWLLVNALEISNPSQKRIIEDNYGNKDEASIKKVMDVYMELGLEEYGYVFKEQFYNDLMNRIDGLPDDFSKQALRNGLMIGYHGY